MSILRQATKRVLEACVPPRWLLTRAPAHAHGQASRLALTFDDGPHPIHTARLLDVLRTHRLQATFYVVGQRAEQYPELVRRIVSEGHEIGNHTWSHGEPAQTSTRQFLDEVRRTDVLLEGLTGAVTQSMRPPKGELNWGKLSGLWRCGKTVALWNVDPRDYRMQQVSEAESWASRFQPKDGDVLLMHDNHPWAANIVELLLDRGVFDRYQPVTVSELAGRSVRTRSQLTGALAQCEQA